MDPEKNHEINIKQSEDRFRENLLPSLSVNTVLFSYHQERLNVLLLKFGDTGYFMLPGGFIRRDEDVDEAALRNLKELTALENIYLEQFYVAGNAERSTDPVVVEFLKKQGYEKISSWLSQRNVSICYLALVNEKKVKPELNVQFISRYLWANVTNLPPLLFDHTTIIEKALSRLQSDMDQKLLSNNLLNEPFTMSDLQKLYEAVFQKKFTRSNFQRKMLKRDILARVGKKYEGRAHKAPYLYRFKKVKAS